VWKIPPFDPSVSLGVVSPSNHWLSSSLSDLGVEDRVVTVRPRSLSLSRVEGSKVEPPEAGNCPCCPGQVPHALSFGTLLRAARA
jgi:hypothetical protein